MVHVELVFVAADQSVFHQCLALAEGAVVADAIQQSGVLVQYPEAEVLSVGIFAKSVTLQTKLQSGDRVELYRPLTVDPKERRRLRGLKKA